MRRGYVQIKSEINNNAKDCLGASISDRGLKRSSVVALWTIAEILLDIREHLDGIEGSA
jgi:hypothetical protein